MDYLLVLILCILATLKVSLQSGFSKNAVKGTADAAIFNGMIFAVISLFFLPSFGEITLPLFLLALVFAFFSVLFQLSYTKALSTGSVSLTVMLVNFNMVLPVLFSFWVHKEPLSPLRLLGILLTALSFVVSTSFSGQKKAEKGWLFYALLSTLASGLANIVQKQFTASSFSDQPQAFLGASYAIGFLMCLVCSLYLKKKGQPKTFPLDSRFFLFALSVGAVLALFQRVNTYAIATVDGTFLFPTYAGGSILLSGISGVLFFHDQLSLRQVLGILLGIAAVVLMNF